MFDVPCTPTLWKMCAWDNVTLIMYTLDIFSIFFFVLRFLSFFLQLLILCGCCRCCCFWHFVLISLFRQVMWMFVVLSWFIKKYASINRFMSLVYIQRFWYKMVTILFFSACCCRNRWINMLSVLMESINFEDGKKLHLISTSIGLIFNSHFPPSCFCFQLLSKMSINFIDMIDSRHCLCFCCCNCFLLFVFRWFAFRWLMRNPGSFPIRILPKTISKLNEISLTNCGQRHKYLWQKEKPNKMLTFCVWAAYSEIILLLANFWSCCCTTVLQ